jgi:Uma2 family endonuclease
MNHQVAVQSVPRQIETALMTGEELLALGDIGPCELLEGMLVKMSPTKPRHGWHEYRLARAIGDFVETQNLGQVQVGEVGIYIRRSPDTVRAADVLFISHRRLAQATPDSFLDVAPELVAEILSPDDRPGQVKRKVREYFGAGVLVVLVVDPVRRTVTAHHASGAVRKYRTGDTVTLPEVLPGFTLSVAALFA